MQHEMYSRRSAVVVIDTRGKMKGCVRSAAARVQQKGEGEEVEVLV